MLSIRFPPGNTKSSLEFHWVFWQVHVNFPHFQQLNPIKINQKNINYFSEVASLWSNCFSHRGEGIPFVLSGKRCTWKRREAQAIVHPGFPKPPWLVPAFVWGCSLCSDFLAVPARQAATRCTQLWQMCSFLHSLNSAGEGWEKKS